MFGKKEGRQERERQQTAQEMLLAGATGYKRYRKNNYFSYVQGSLRTSAFFRLLKKGFLIARRLSFVSFLLTVGTMLLSALETGALFLLISAFYLTFFPFFVLPAGIAILSGILLGSRRRTQLGTAVKNKHVTVFFPVRGSGFAASSFFKANAVCMAAAADSVVLVVTPYFWSLRGLGGHGFFNAFRQEGEHLFLLRRRFWFSFYRKVLVRYATQMVLVY